MMKLVVIMTVHNRCRKTLLSLRHLFSNFVHNIDHSVIIFDDGSSDGTRQAINAEFPQVQIVQGDGSYFWNGGMHSAWETASLQNPDFYLWLNDDTLLDEYALDKMMRTSALFADQAIIVGSTTDSTTNKVTYGGVKRKSKWQPLKFVTLTPKNLPQRADTMNGNCVMIPRAVYSKVGNLSKAYTHSMGDFDYGLRAAQYGVEIWVTSGVVGKCDRNSLSKTWQDRSLPWRTRWNKALNVKGLPPKEWGVFASRHGGIIWPFLWLWPYVNILIPKSAASSKSISIVNKSSKKVTIIYKSLPQYRREFFELLRNELTKYDIEFQLIYGQPNRYEAAKNDTVTLIWGKEVKSIILGFKGKSLYWQPVLKLTSDSDLIIFEQASKLLVNYVLILRGIFTGQKVAFWGHGKNFQPEGASHIGEMLKKFVSRKVSWWFAYNNTSADVVKQMGFPPEKITIVMNSINTTHLAQGLKSVSSESRSQLKSELNIDSNNVGIFAGGMYPEKRLAFLLNACEIIKTRLPDFQMIFIGSGIDSDIVRRACQSNKWMHFIGPKFDDDKILYFAISKVFLMPGLVGLAILDSFALETPMITTNLSYHSPEIEYLNNKVNGIIVEESDSVEEYANAVIDTMTDNKKLELLIHGCIESKQEYTLEKMVTKFADGIRKSFI